MAGILEDRRFRIAATVIIVLTVGAGILFGVRGDPVTEQAGTNYHRLTATRTGNR